MKHRKFINYLKSLKVFAAKLLALALSWTSLSSGAEMVGNHPAVRDERGILLPWMPWRPALEREVAWYLKCPVEHGYPRFVYMTFMDGDYRLIEKRPSFIPATQNGMGIISYLKWHDFTGRKDPRLVQMARYLGDYLVKEAITPDTGKYPRFSRSTGWAGKFPQPPDCGSQDDKPYDIQPDKGGIAGYALLLLHEETKDQKYFDQALQNARVLVANMGQGTATNSPWPFRVDYRTGEASGAVSGNMSFILRLFDKLIEHGHKEFQTPRDNLWAWIKNVQIPDAAKNGALMAQFFEDHHGLDNRTAWSPLNLARYLLEKKEALDPDWQKDARTLIEFVNRTFTHIFSGVVACGEQDGDQRPWGGIASCYGAVLAMFTKATGSDEFKGIAYQTLNYTIYSINDDGCPYDGIWKGDGRGGWQEDAHTDKLHNYVDAMNAFPEWAK